MGRSVTMTVIISFPRRLLIHEYQIARHVPWRQLAFLNKITSWHLMWKANFADEGCAEAKSL